MIKLLHLTEKQSNNFWNKVLKTDSHADCWLWMGSTRIYGKFQFNGKYLGAHRMSYMIHFGPIPEGLYVCHRCDEPRCINPNHLFLGTPKQNTLDMIVKGRDKVLKVDQTGHRSTSAKLTEEEATLIKFGLKHLSNAGVAKYFGNKITRGAVSAIRIGRSWKHLKH